MPDDWTDHCPIDEDEWPVQRQAWHAGWIYRMEHGPRLSDERAKEIHLEIMSEYNPSMVSIWIQGYTAAHNHLEDRPQD